MVPSDGSACILQRGQEGKMEAMEGMSIPKRLQSDNLQSRLKLRQRKIMAKNYGKKYGKICIFGKMAYWGAGIKILKLLHCISLKSKI